MSETQQDHPRKKIAIRRTDPNDVPLIFANDFAMTNTGNDVFLVFSQVQPPVDLKAETIGAMTELPAVAVAKVVVNITLAKAIVKVMGDNLKQPTAILQ